MVPPFRAAARDRSAIEGSLRWRPADGVVLDLRVDALRDAYPTGEVRIGPGDVRLGTAVRLWQGPVELGLGWQVKLPNAADLGEIGSDETDATLLAAASAPLGATTLFTTIGLDILGNPLQFANQDDVPLVHVGGMHTLSAVELSVRAGGGLPTSRNPARLEAAAGLETACPLRIGAEGAAGLTAAAPDWSVRAWGGWSWGCQEAGRD